MNLIVVATKRSLVTGSVAAGDDLFRWFRDSTKAVLGANDYLF